MPRRDRDRDFRTGKKVDRYCPVQTLFRGGGGREKRLSNVVSSLGRLFNNDVFAFSNVYLAIPSVNNTVIHC